MTGTPGSFLDGGRPLSAWGSGGAGAASSRPEQPCRHAYPIALRRASFAMAVWLLLRTLPYALVRFALLLVFVLGTLAWFAAAIGGGVWLGTHTAEVIGWVWGIGGVLLYSFVWYAVLRYALHVIECGHVAVLTQLILYDRRDPGDGTMFAQGIAMVRRYIGQITVLYGLHAVIRGIVEGFNRTLDFIGQMVPVPGVAALLSLVHLVLRAATRYIDKAIFSYNLARGDSNPWRSSQDGILYYCQNAKEILKKAAWLVVLDKLLTVILWLALLAPSVAVALLLPAAMREWGTALYLVIAALFASCLRAAFLKPAFLVIVLIRYHTLIENQAIDPEWDSYLSGLSGRFAGLKAQAQSWAPGPPPR